MPATKLGGGLIINLCSINLLCYIFTVARLHFYSDYGLLHVYSVYVSDGPAFLGGGLDSDG